MRQGGVGQGWGMSQKVKENIDDAGNVQITCVRVYIYVCVGGYLAHVQIRR
jgi:hypothetical protein